MRKLYSKDQITQDKMKCFLKDQSYLFDYGWIKIKEIAYASYGLWVLWKLTFTISHVLKKMQMRIMHKLVPRRQILSKKWHSHLPWEIHIKFLIIYTRWWKWKSKPSWEKICRRKVRQFWTSSHIWKLWAILGVCHSW